jgi:hypothetical protein
MMKTWEVTSITNFVAAGEAFLAAGYLLGRIDLSATAACCSRGRMIMQKATWICIGIMTFFTLLTALYRFASVGWHIPVAIIGFVQFLIFCFFAVRIHKYLVVIINYAPILLLLLVLNLIGLPSGSGSWWFITGILISIAASGLQALGVDNFSPVDRNGLYHIVTMGAIIFFFIGGLDL